MQPTDLVLKMFYSYLPCCLLPPFYKLHRIENIPAILSTLQPLLLNMQPITWTEMILEFNNIHKHKEWLSMHPLYF